MHYLYRVTNLIDGKYYIGMAKSQNPETHRYMGSGVKVKRAIAKYGMENFRKEILLKSDDRNTIAEAEALYVTRTTLDDPLCYNMHEGGHGGWAHINRAQPKDRKNVQSFLAKVESGEVKVGGTKNWSGSSWERARAQGAKNREAGCGKLSWANMSEEARADRKRRLSERQSGSKNNSFGKSWYNDGEKNFLLVRGEHPGLVLGRLSKK